MLKVSRLMVGKKTASIRYFVTERFKVLLRKNWDFLNFPTMARMKRSFKNPKLKVPFDSESDFVTTNLRAIFLMRKFDYDFHMERNNPDHPDFPEVLK